MLEAMGLYKTFHSKNKPRSALLGASLTIDDAEKVGIFGKSGEGKSTFANILCGLLRPDAGNVYLDEMPLYNKKSEYNQTVGKKIQLIPQQPYSTFDPVQKVGRAVEEVIRVNGHGISRAQAKGIASELFERVLLDTALMDRLPSQLSGGQVQRAAIARALAMQPDVIIADEATSMLDTSSQAQIMRIMQDLAENDGISVICISHDLNLLSSFADVVYKLDGGVFQVVGKTSDKGEIRC